MEHRDNTAFRHDPITPDDGGSLPSDIVSILIIGGGDLSVMDRFGETIVYSSLPAFTTLPNFRPFRINATGTTATNIIAIRPPRDVMESVAPPPMPQPGGAFDSGFDNGFDIS